MNTGGSSQSQASYLESLEEKPNIEASTQQLLDEQTAVSVMKKLAAAMTVEEGENFDSCLKSLKALFQKGYSSLFMTYDGLMRKMMNHFTKLGKCLQDDNPDSKVESRMIFVLSLIAELLRENPKFYYPFTRKFLHTVFMIDAELLQGSVYKNSILAILAVIYQNFSRQPKLVKKYNMEVKLKSSLLGNYSLVEELFTLKTFNKSIVNLVSKGVPFSVAEFRKHRILDTVSNFISKSQLELFMVKLKLTILSKAQPQTPA